MRCGLRRLTRRAAPIVQELTSDGTATFHFIHGPCEAVPPEGFESFFGKPPYYRFIEPDDPESEDTDVLNRIRDFPQCDTPEQAMRELMKEGVASCIRSTYGALMYLYNVMHEQGPFDGIIGYSEGATVAATLLLHEQVMAERKGYKPMFKYGVFFGGWPPMDPDTFRLVLADETDLRIQVPTCHISEFLRCLSNAITGKFRQRKRGLQEKSVHQDGLLTHKTVGSLDPYLDGSMALYNACEPDTAYLFDHAKGHTLPRDKDIVKELGDVIRDQIAGIERDDE